MLPSFEKMTGSTREAKRVRAEVAEPIPSGSSFRPTASLARSSIATPGSSCARANLPSPMVPIEASAAARRMDHGPRCPNRTSFRRQWRERSSN